MKKIAQWKVPTYGPKGKSIASKEDVNKKTIFEKKVEADLAAKVPLFDYVRNRILEREPHGRFWKSPMVNALIKGNITLYFDKIKEEVWSYRENGLNTLFHNKIDSPTQYLFEELEGYIDTLKVVIAPKHQSDTLSMPYLFYLDSYEYDPALSITQKSVDYLILDYRNFELQRFRRKDGEWFLVTEEAKEKAKLEQQSSVFFSSRFYRGNTITFLLGRTYKGSFPISIPPGVTVTGRNV